MNAEFDGIKKRFDEINPRAPAFEQAILREKLQHIENDLKKLLEDLSNPVCLNHPLGKKLHAEVQAFQQQANYNKTNLLHLQDSQQTQLQIEVIPSNEHQHSVLRVPNDTNETDGKYYINREQYYEKQGARFSYAGPVISDVDKMLRHAYQTYGLPDSGAKVILSGSDELVRQAYIYYKALNVEVILKQPSFLDKLSAEDNAKLNQEIAEKDRVFKQKKPTEIGVHESLHKPPESLRNTNGPGNSMMIYATVI
jgi:hypothetical protein